MKKHASKLIAVSVSALISVIIALSFTLGVKSVPVPKLSKTDEGTNYYSISDITSSINLLRYVYYTPDEFVLPGEGAPVGELVDLQEFRPDTKRGTYQFFIANIDPFDENFYELHDSLSQFLSDDNYWRFSVKLPPCFSACCVYVKSVLTARAGEIKDYDYIRYSDKNGFSEEHSSEARPLYLDLSFYTRQQGIPPAFYMRAVRVTIHYESDGAVSGYNLAPVIGTTEAIERQNDADVTFFTFLALASALVFAILAFASLLKKSLFMLPQGLIAAGICGYSLFSVIMLTGTSMPLLGYYMIFVSVGLLLAAALLSLAYAFKLRKTEFLLAPPAVLTFMIALPFVSFSLPAILTPTVWLLLGALCITAFSTFKFFIELERRNIYLTNNLQAEVSCQTEALKNIIDEHDKLLRYLSHDMKKPIISVKKFIAEIRKNEQNDENKKALDVIDKKINDIESNISQLQKYSKDNFAAEESIELSAPKFLQSVVTALQPDCEANGIILNFTRSRMNIKIFTKQNALYSVLSNLIFNAIEHAGCTHIDIGVRRTKGVCKITVADDGNGIKDGKEIFTPYVSEGTDEGNLGLGLYICKQHMAAMNGDLEYERADGKTVFTVTLPLA